MEALIRYKNYAEDPWAAAGKQTIFFLNSRGKSVQSKAPDLPPGCTVPCRELENTGASFSSVPRARFTRAVQELVFFGRSKGPWTAAYGNEDYGPLAGLNPEDYGTKGREPETGEARIMGGRYEARPFRVPKAEKNRGQILLWTIPITAALLLTGLALHIAKSMHKDGGTLR
jgi:hypothetical protein